MSLEDLKAQAEAEEENTEEQEPETQDEPEQEEAEDAEAEEGSSEEEEGDETEDEPSDDFELELDGEPEPGQQKPSPEDALVYKLTKQKAKAKEYKSELEELKAELAALKSGTSQPQAQQRPQQPAQHYPPVPVLYEDGIDTKEQYTQAYQRWMADCKAIDQRNAQADQQKSEYKRQMEDMTHNLAKRLGKFASEHKIKDDRVISAAEKATSEIDEATKIEGSLAYLLDSVGDGGERVAYYIGTNEGAMAKVKELLQADSTGLKAVAHMTKLAAQLKPKHSIRTSKAPAPDRPVKGDGSSVGSIAKKLQAEWDKATKREDLMNVRRKAREAGVKLRT